MNTGIIRVFFSVCLACFLGLGSLPPRSTRLGAEDSARTLSIKAVGDIMPGTNFPRNYLPPGGGESLFRRTLPYLKGADILFGNLESVLTRRKRTPKNTRRRMVFAFRTPPSYARSFRQAGFNVLSIANNHSLDFYARGFRDTARAVRRAGMSPVGKKNEIVYMGVKGLRVAFIGFSHYRFHNSVNELAAARRLVRRAAGRADIVVVSAHMGAEGPRALRVRNRREIYYGQNRGNPVRFARLVVDAGADLVLGHGPHVPRALELYKGRLIAYSLGNFIGYRMFSLSGPKGLSLVLEARLDRRGRFLEGRIIPLRVLRPGIPRFDPEGRTITLMRRLTKSDFPRTTLVITRRGNILPSARGTRAQ